VEAKVRSWFVRNALEAIERLHKTSELDRLRGAVPKRLAPLLNAERWRAAGPLDAIALEDAEDLLFAIDGVIGHGAGASMEAVAEAVVTRAVLDGTASVSVGDLVGSMTRLQSWFEAPFVGASLIFEIGRTQEGFTLTIGIHGRPRATRLLRHYAVGAIRAVARFAREPARDELRVSGESIADRAMLTVSLRGSAAPAAPIARRSKPPELHNTGPRLRLSAEVERILGKRRESDRAEADQRDSTPPPPSRRSSERPPGRTG
jgi:hypothetical protein